MKYYTQDAYIAWYKHLDDKLMGVAYRGYQQHLKEMRGVLPEEALALTGMPNMDDLPIVRVRHDPQAKVLTLVVRCGDRIHGYYDLDIRYEGAEISPEHEQTLAWIARSECELFQHEVDRAEDGRIEHRWLFHPWVWFAVRCDALHWERIPRPDWRLPRYRDRFPGGPPGVKPDNLSE